MSKSDDTANDRPRVALISSGLGLVRRGFETSTMRWYRALSRLGSMDVRLITGSPCEDGESVATTIARNSILFKPLLSLPFVPEEHRWRLTYGLEQISFLAGLIPRLAAVRPDVVWVKDVPLAHMLLAARQLHLGDYRLVFANGGAFKTSTYSCFDHIQQLHPFGYEQAIEDGLPGERMDLISNCIDPPAATSVVERDLIRRQLGFSESDWVVVCTAAWNRYHKRIDYLIEEVARLADPEVKLLLCGMPEADTQQLKAMGTERLGDHRIRWLTVPPDRVLSVMGAADVFVLPSLNEGLGNVLIEAAVMGLPIVCHPHGGARFIIRDEYWMTDLTEPGALASRLMRLRKEPPPASRLAVLSEDVADRFSGSKLAVEFERMVQRVLSRNQAARSGFREMVTHENR